MASPQPTLPTLRPDSIWTKVSLHRVPGTILLVTAFVSYLITAICYLQGVGPYIAFALAMIPWIAIVFLELDWTYHHFGWFSLFMLMGFVQCVHYSEHCIEVIQNHFFGVSAAEATAIFTQFNVEGVHFGGDTFLTIGTILLLWKFPRNPWLWVAVVPQIAHQAEHTFLFFNYIFEGTKAGGPGLLISPGGAIGGGIGLNRPDTHFIYNTLYTIPFVTAFFWQLKRTYDDTLHNAFPDAPPEELREISKKLETFKYRPTQTVLAPGDDANRLYIITEGQAAVLQPTPEGDIELATLHTGDYFGEVELLMPQAAHTKIIRAKTDLSVFAMDEPTFRQMLEMSPATKRRMLSVAEAREGRKLDKELTGAGAG